MALQKLIKDLQLLPHPEGGFYVETFRDNSVVLPSSVLPSTYKVGRPVSTAIYFLVPTGSKSRLHRIPSAEVWHFYDGEPLTVLELGANGATKRTVLGLDFAAGQVPQYTVPPYVWFGAYPTKDYTIDTETGNVEKLAARDEEKHYSLVGCTVAPAFQFEDFELAKSTELLALFPEAKAFIELLT